MRKRILGALLAAACLLGLASVAAWAESYSGSASWTVTFTAGKEMRDTFPSSGYADALDGLQPGDDLTVSVTLTNRYAEATDWYMSNEVLHSLEDSAGASGGAYAYALTYAGPSGGATTIYDSRSVGGDVQDGGAGLHEVTAMEDLFYLGPLGTGESGVVTLRVELDGETQGNAYMDALADLQMNFAVDVPPTGEPTRRTVYRQRERTIVRTGDDASMLPLYAAMCASGLGLAWLAARELRGRKGGAR